MRTNGTGHLVLVFAQVIAAASLGCGGNVVVVPAASSGDDASSPSDSGALDSGGYDSGNLPDADEDSGPIGCGGCGCGGGGSGSWTATLDGGLDAASDAALDCVTICEGQGHGTTGFCTLVDAAAPATITCEQVCLGRRPEGLRGAPSRGRAAGAYFASMAQLEAASVPAFRRVARELSVFGAPRRLVRAAERAAREEIVHARGARALARRHGAIDAPFAASPHDARTLEAFAIENAVEGCVRETYGALVATWQARAASDPRVRTHFARIARDETNHAALAFRIDAWTRARLDRDARARVAAARDAARADLRAAIERETPDASIAALAGLPQRSLALALASQLEARLG